MNDISYTISIKRKGDSYEAYCEGAKKVIEGPCAYAHGKTPLEAAENAYQAFVGLIAEENELTDSAGIDFTWDELLSSPESHAFLDKLGKEALAKKEKGNLIPGGFDGIGDFSDELEAAVKALIAMVREGMAENEQQRMSGWIHEFLAVISVNRLCDDNEE